MEKCAKFLVDSSGQIQKMVSEMSCDQSVHTITQYPNWFIFGGIALVILVAWFLVGYPRWSVWASQKSGEADLAQAHKEQQIQVSKAQGRLDAATLNKNAAIVEAEAVSSQIEKIGKQLTEHDLYLKWQWIKMMEEGGNSVIYVPTEANLPILEAGKRIQNI